MKKILLVHSYSDFNKGDAGIIISTIQRLRETYPGATIGLVSTFSKLDPAFKEQHEDIKEFADDIYGAIFPELFFKIGDRVSYSTFAKLLSMIFFSFRYSFFYLFYKLFSKVLFLNEDERETFSAIKDCDILISKGGSFICSHGTFREDFSLIRMLFPFYASKLVGKRNVILAQSLGPFDSKLSRYIMKVSYDVIDRIYLREHKSKELLDSCGLEIPSFKLGFCPDTAFSLDSSSGEIICSRDDSKLNVGMTIVDHNFDHNVQRCNYIDSIVGVIKHLVTERNAVINIFPQVIRPTQFGEMDILLSREIYKLLPETIAERVNLIDGNFRALDLAKTYSKMDVFIATRLHSSIFSATHAVPFINIAYHGTKSEGTLALLDHSDFVIRITSITPSQLIAKVDDLISNQETIRLKIADAVNKVNRDIKNAVVELDKIDA